MFSTSLIQPPDESTFHSKIPSSFPIFTLTIERNLSYSILKSRKVNLSSAFNNLESSEACSRIDYDPETQTQWVNVHAPPPKEELPIFPRKLSQLSTNNNSSKTLSSLRPITQFGTPTSNSQPGPYLQFCTSSRPITGTSVYQETKVSNPTLYTTPGTSQKNFRLSDPGLVSSSNLRLTSSRNVSVNNFKLSNADTSDTNFQLNFHQRRVSAPKNIETGTSQFYLATKTMQSPRPFFGGLTVKGMNRSGRSKDVKMTEVDQNQNQGVKVVHSFRRLSSTSAKKQALLAPKIEKPKPLVKGKSVIMKDKMRVSKVTHGNVAMYKLSQLLDLKPKEVKANP